MCIRDRLYKECGRSPYHPKMMLKVILYAYMNNIYSCRKIEKLLHRDIHLSLIHILRVAVDENRCHGIEQLLTLKSPAVDAVLLDEDVYKRQPLK